MILVFVSDSFLQVDLCWSGLVDVCLLYYVPLLIKILSIQKKSIISFLHDCLAAAWTYMKELVNITNWILIWS